MIQLVAYAPSLVAIQDVENGRSRVAATDRRANAEARLAEARGNLEVSKAEVSACSSMEFI